MFSMIALDNEPEDCKTTGFIGEIGLGDRLNANIGKLVEEVAHFGEDFGGCRFGKSAEVGFRPIGEEPSECLGNFCFGEGARSQGSRVEGCPQSSVADFAGFLLLGNGESKPVFGME
jgi:hypothetical protein